MARMRHICVNKNENAFAILNESWTIHLLIILVSWWLFLSSLRTTKEVLDENKVNCIVICETLICNFILSTNFNLIILFICSSWLTHKIWSNFITFFKVVSGWNYCTVPKQINAANLNCIYKYIYDNDRCYIFI